MALFDDIFVVLASDNNKDVVAFAGT